MGTLYESLDIGLKVILTSVAISIGVLTCKSIIFVNTLNNDYNEVKAYVKTNAPITANMIASDYNKGKKYFEENCHAPVTDCINGVPKLVNEWADTGTAAKEALIKTATTLDKVDKFIDSAQPIVDTLNDNLASENSNANRGIIRKLLDAIKAYRNGIPSEKNPNKPVSSDSSSDEELPDLEPVEENPPKNCLLI